MLPDVAGSRHTTRPLRDHARSSAPVAWARSTAPPTPNLKRAVAIKVLPEALVADHERLARFQREAEVLASLNHPHIAQIHGLEKTAGASAW